MQDNNEFVSLASKKLYQITRSLDKLQKASKQHFGLDTNDIDYGDLAYLTTFELRLRDLIDHYEHLGQYRQEKTQEAS